MEDRFFTYQHARLHFLKSGNGPNILLSFHGFGQDHEAFEELTHAFRNQYTVYAFDIFFHGKSAWGKDEDPLEKEFWNELLAAFLKQHTIDKFSLLGFSMGGKFALASLEAFPERVQSVYLLAPDGIKTSAWYSLATYPFFLRRVFKNMISNPTLFHQITQVAFKTGLIDKGILRFVQSQMDTEEKRKQVYLSWVVFRHLHFNMTAIANSINAYAIAVTIVVGKYDKIITAKNMERLTKRLTHYSLNTLETGHTGILSKFARLVTSDRNDSHSKPGTN